MAKKKQCAKGRKPAHRAYPPMSGDILLIAIPDKRYDNRAKRDKAKGK